MDLTTLARVKEYITRKGNPDFRADAESVLSSMISSVSQRMEQYCSRLFQVGATTERGTLRCDEFICSRVPLASISSVRYSETGRGADLAALPSSQYEISPSGDNVRVYDVTYGGLVEVSYTGGVATDTQDVIDNHPALEEACKLQVASLWQRHTMPDRSGVTIGTGETSWTGDYSMLKEVQATLDQNYNNRHKFI